MVCSGRSDNTMRLTALDEKAEKLGLRKGLGVAEARAIHPVIDVIEEDAAADRRLLDAIADWCDRYTPLVALDGKDGLFLDITGCSHLFGGERAMLKDILLRLHQMGLDVGGAISSSPGLSWAVSRFGEGGVIAEDEAGAVLEPLPVTALRLDAPVVAALQKLGLRYIGDLMQAPRAPLTRRFGALVLLRLDQALGLDEEPVSPRLPIASLSAERRLAEAITAEEDILLLAGQVAHALQPSLETQGIGGRVFELVLFRVDGCVFRISAGTSRPLRDPQRIASLFCERLTAIHDDLDAGYGFEILRINVLRHENFQNEQDDFEGERQTAISLAGFVDKVSARLGEECLIRFEQRESHVPERAVFAVPAIETLNKSPREPAAPMARGDRPVRLLAMPEPMEAFAAEVPDGAPAYFRWRRIRHRILKSEGPERIAMEWWIDGVDAKERDYFSVEDEQGYRFWIYREGHYGPDMPQWFMHGVFA
ncbi:DNA polymerase Y family protein [Rhizobium sp. SIMBA_035]